MPTFAANLSMLFTELPLAQRFAACASAGFRYCEIQFPYELPAPQMAALLAEHGLQLVLHNLPAGNWAAGERGIACLPERQEEFRAGVAQAIAYAQQVGVTQLNCLAGIAPSTLAPQLAHDCLLENVRYACEQLHANGMRLLLEPINTFDIPGFFLNTPSQALALIRQAAQPNVFLQYDCYHAQRMEGELAGTLQRALPQIGHIQIADNPGRHQPGSGEIAYPFLFDWLDQLGYAGYVGCEYVPLGNTLESLAWCKPWLRQG